VTKYIAMIVWSHLKLQLSRSCSTNRPLDLDQVLDLDLKLDQVLDLDLNLIRFLI
jgi:hypothetical protein